ncbi:PFL_4669 family integrating conjugative element protein [Burkholderia gladioli]|uniref:PFL_4669 family integrating conjugative element protein n=1 Tax=Burkholderia gladioli TaxID=28095 RepID=UPI00163E2B67|nr:TIGR03761 family integrating conjugative element protein [Burkholderia gladioli]
MPSLRRRRLFDDNYNIDRERRDLRDMLEGPVKPSDPRLPRFQELLRREEILRLRAEAAAAAATGAGSVDTAPQASAKVVDSDTATVNAMPPLANSQEEAMILHTKDAYRLFTGRQADLPNRVQPTYGVRYCAFALRNLWTLSNLNNPYADWALVNIDSELDALKRFLQQQIASETAAIDKLREGGLEVAVLQSSRPQRTVLNFSSPYAYAVIQLLLGFDKYVRIVRTLGRRSVLSDEDVTKAIRTVARRLRHTFLNVIRYARVLTSDKLKGHTRDDFEADAPAAAIDRRTILEQIYGALPANILDGSLRPRHSKRAKLTMKQRGAAAADDEAARTNLRQSPEDDLL